ncbi:hypothetical protein Tco_0889529 [Tanacetum coccineum]
MVNEVRQLQALIDKKKVIITEASIRNDLHLDDAEVFINQQLGDMSHHKKTFVNPFHTKKIFANINREGKDFSGKVTPLFDSMLVQATEEVGEDSIPPTDSTQIPIMILLPLHIMINQYSLPNLKTKKKQLSNMAQRREAEVPQDAGEHEESVPIPSNDPQPSGEDSMQLTNLMVLCTKLQTQVLDLQIAKDAQAKEIATLKKRIQRLERRKMSRPTGLKRLRKGRSIEDIDADVDVTLVDETQERQDDDLMFDTIVLEDDEMHGKLKCMRKKKRQYKPMIVLLVKQFKAAKPKVCCSHYCSLTTTTTTDPMIRGGCNEPSEFQNSTRTQPSSSKDKGKGIMIEPEVPLKRKDQIALDEQITRDI